MNLEIFVGISAQIGKHCKDQLRFFNGHISYEILDSGPLKDTKLQPNKKRKSKP